MDIQIVVLSLALAFLAESMVEYVFGTLAEKVVALQPFRWLLAYVALAVGVGMAFWYQIDLITLITAEAPTTLGIVLSGLGIGRGANFIHDFVSNYIPNGSNR